MDAKLVIVDGEGKGREVALHVPAVVGRSREAGLTIAHPLVSRQHCEIYEQDGRLVVRDLGSLNGTFIDDSRISEEILQPGAKLTIGGTTFEAVYPDVPRPPAGPSDTTDLNVVDAAKPSETPGVGQTVRVVPSGSASLTPSADASTPASDEPAGDLEEIEELAEEEIEELEEVEALEEVEEVDEVSSALQPPPRDAKPTQQPRPSPPSPPQQAEPAANKAAPAGANKPAGQPKKTKPAKAASPAKYAGPDFGFAEGDQAARPAADDDDLNDFLKSLG